VLPALSDAMDYALLVPHATDLAAQPFIPPDARRDNGLALPGAPSLGYTKDLH